MHTVAVQRAHGLPVDVVAHHRKARGQVLCLEVLCQRQGGVMLRYAVAEGAEFCEGEIEGHDIYYCITFFSFVLNNCLQFNTFYDILIFIMTFWVSGSVRGILRTIPAREERMSAGTLKRYYLSNSLTGKLSTKFQLTTLIPPLFQHGVAIFAFQCV